MKTTPKPYTILTWLLTFLLVGAIVANWFLYKQGRGYYEQLNALRLDPVGLSHYSTAPNQHVADPEQTTVVLFGDSRAAQWPAPTVPRFTFVNRGIGSETSAQALQRFEAHVSPLQPDVVIVQVGVNDLKTIPLFPERKAETIANCQANIRQIIDRATDLGANVIVTTILPLGKVPLERRLFWSEDVGLALDQVNVYIRSLAESDITVLDTFSVLADEHGVTQSVYSADLLHLSAIGYEVLNKELTKTLEALND